MSQQRLMQECFEQSYSQEWEKAGDHERYVWEEAWWASRAVLEKEAKAAPVGEREAFETWFNKEKLPSVSYGNPNILKKPLWPAFQAGAAHQRQQAREVVMPERKVVQHGDVLSFQDEGWNACLDEFARLNGKEVGRE